MCTCRQEPKWRNQAARARTDRAVPRSRASAQEQRTEARTDSDLSTRRAEEEPPVDRRQDKQRTPHASRPVAGPLAPVPSREAILFLFSIVRIHPSRSPVLDRIYIIHYAEILTKLHARTVFDLKVFFLSPLLGLTDGDAEGAGRTQADSSSEYNPSDFVSICGSKRFSRVPGVPPLSCISLRLAEAACCEGGCISW